MKSQFRISIDDLFAMEEELIFLKLLVKKIRKKYSIEISDKAIEKLRMRARARVEFDYQFHKINQQ